MAGSNLDAASVRAELEEAPGVHGLDEAAAARIIALDDEVLDAAVLAAADDSFWEAHDNLRSRAIAALAQEHLPTMTETTAPRCSPDEDGFCPAHNNDCDDYHLHLTARDQT